MNEDDFAARRRREEAAQWFARLKALPVSQGTLRDFFAWRRQPGNAEAFEEAERFWSDAGKVGERPSILRAVEEAASRGRAPRRLGRLTRPLSLLAVAVALVLLAYASLHIFGPGGQAFRTSTGEQRVIALDDGSRFNMNAETAVIVRYSPRARNLELEGGEALFSVARDKTRPFTVTAGGATVTATGTRFEVAMRESRIFVTLLEGRVSVRAPDGSIQPLQPGEQWRWPAYGARVHTVKPETVTAWMQGRIVFDNTALADAITEINRYGGKPVVLAAPQFGTRRISGSFEAGDSESFATAVTSFLPLRRTLDDQGHIRLMPRSPSAQE